MNPTRINLYGGPGIGKSLTAATVFAELKKSGYEVELIREYIKDWAWLKIIPESTDQLYVFAKQVRSEDIVLRHKHTHVVTDSPIFMQLAYMKRGDYVYYKPCAEIAKEIERQFPSLHIILKRTVRYNEKGRYENFNQACQMDHLIKCTLIENDVSYVELDPVKEFKQILCAAEVQICDTENS